MGRLPVQDPVRAAVPSTIDVCQEAGITVKMVTGAGQALALNFLVDLTP
jgi:magnesium-transporting ATPase (P-type)